MPVNMSNKEQPFQLLPETFKVISKCPVCSHAYTNIDAKLLDEDGDSHLVYIRCSKCQTAILALVVFQTVGIISYGLITDLTEEEVFKFKDAEGLSDDYVLDIYNILQKDSSFIKALKK